MLILSRGPVIFRNDSNIYQIFFWMRVIKTNKMANVLTGRGTSHLIRLQPCQTKESVKADKEHSGGFL